MQQFTKDMNIIAKLDDEPNDVGGLTAAQLKGKFDEGGVAVKEYINGVLLPELERIDATLPVKGVDYFTEEDKSEMVSEVLANLTLYAGETEALA